MDNHNNGCSGKLSIRENLFFSKSKLTLQEYVRLVFQYFIGHYSIKQTALNLGIASSIVASVFQKVRRTISEYIQLGYEMDTILLFFM